MARFEIVLSELDSGPKEWVFPLDPIWLNEILDCEGFRVDKSVIGEVLYRAERLGKKVLFRGMARASLIGLCGRCLEETSFSVSAEMVVDFVQVQGPFFPWSKGVIDLRPEDLDIEFFEGESIPLDGIIREHIVLEIPMKLLCRPDCRGIEIAKDACGLPSDGSSTPQEAEIPPSIEALAQKWRAKHGRGISGPTKRKH